MLFMPAKKGTLLDLLSHIPDGRHKRGRRFKLHHVLAASILAMLTGSNTLRSIELWMSSNRGRLNQRFGFGWKTTPSKSSLSNFFASVDQAAFATAVASLAGAESKGPIACDGKCMRGEGQDFLSIFDAETLRALERVAFSKGKEAETLRSWLEAGGAKGRTATADAAHFQKRPSKPLN